MRALIGAVLLAVFLLPGEASAERSGITVYGPGNSQCRQWTSDQTGNPAAAYVDKIWVLGFLSAYNNYMVHGTPGLSTDETTSFFDWISQYCGDHPSDSLAVATAKLVEHLKGE